MTMALNGVLVPLPVKPKRLSGSNRESHGSFARDGIRRCVVATPTARERLYGEYPLTGYVEE